MVHYLIITGGGGEVGRYLGLGEGSVSWGVALSDHYRLILHRLSMTFYCARCARLV